MKEGRKISEWDSVVPQSLNWKVKNRSGFYETRAFEWCKNHWSRISKTYSKVIKPCLILVVKVNGQGQFLTIFCLWSHLFLTFAWHHQSPGAILIQPRDWRKKNNIFTLVRSPGQRFKKSELKTLAVDFDHESLLDHFHLLMKPHFQLDL